MGRIRLNFYLQQTSLEPARISVDPGLHQVVRYEVVLLDIYLHRGKSVLDILWDEHSDQRRLEALEVIWWEEGGDVGKFERCNHVKDVLGVVECVAADCCVVRASDEDL